MEFLAKDNEDRKVLGKRMNRLLLILLLNRLYSKQVLEPITYRPHIDFLDNKPENQKIELLKYEEKKKTLDLKSMWITQFNT
jgi:hypothetical protein